MLIIVTLDMTIKELNELVDEINETDAKEYLNLKNLDELQNPDVWAQIKALWNVRDHLIEFNTTINHPKVDVNVTLRQTKKVDQIIDSLAIHMQNIIADNREKNIRESLAWYKGFWEQKGLTYNDEY